MIDSWKGWLFVIAMGMTLSASAATPAPPPPGPAEPPKEVGPVLKAMLGDERVAVEKEIAARMMKRGDLGGDKRAVKAIRDRHHAQHADQQGHRGHSGHSKR